MSDEPSAASRPVKLETLLQVLQEGTIEVQGLLPNGSNYTFFALVSQEIAELQMSFGQL